MMKQNYSVLSSKKLFEGVVFDVEERDIEVRTPNSNGLDEVNTIVRQVVTYGDSVLIVPITKDRKHVLMGEEYRTVTNGTQIGFPAGRIDDTDTNYIQAVNRELREELGVTAIEGFTPVHLFSAHASLGYTLEKIHAYAVIVDDSLNVGTEFDADEYVELRKVRLSDVEDMLRNEIVTSMSCHLAYLKTLELMGEGRL